MPDDPRKTKEDQQLVSRQDYEVEEFARKYDLGRGEAAVLIKRYGPSRSKLDALLAQRFHG